MFRFKQSRSITKCEIVTGKQNLQNIVIDSYFGKAGFVNTLVKLSSSFSLFLQLASETAFTNSLDFHCTAIHY